jgi:hypothetical protein
MICPERFALIGIALGLAALPACGDPESRQFEELTTTDRGAVCLLPADTGLAVDVIFDVCLNDCVRADGATCSAEVNDAQEVVVTSELTVTSETTPGGLCQLYCRLYRVSCGIIQPDSESIRIIHGTSDSGLLPVPTASVTELFGPPRGACKD